MFLPLFSTVRPPPTSTLFPYTTLFRSGREREQRRRAGGEHEQALGRRASQFGGDDQTARRDGQGPARARRDRKSTRLNSSHLGISYAVFCLKKKKKIEASRSNKTNTHT